LFADAHAHLRGDLVAVLQRAKKNKVELILAAGTDLQSSINAVNVSKRYELVYACVGIHPWNADKLNQNIQNKLLALTSEEKVIAISEIGLDFMGRMDLSTRIRSEPLPKKLQIKTFQSQVMLAKEVNLPIILHCNAAHQEVLEILKKEKASEFGGAVHGFNGNIMFAKEYIKLGFYISIGRRAITSPDNVSIQEISKRIPLENLLIETDSNDPANVKDIADKIADLKGISIEEVGLTTTSNLRSLLRI